MTQTDAVAEVGLIGLGTMGGNLALNIAENGFQIAVYNRTTSKTDEFMTKAGPLAEKLVPSQNAGSICCLDQIAPRRYLDGACG